MAFMNDMIRSVGKAEFLNLTPLDINPGISKCEIAVAYEGANRNGSYISHEEMENLGKTLRGVPIVGYYSGDKDDFTDHGHRLTIDSDGMREEILTVPYGFISPDSEVWFQKVEENSQAGPVERTYLMCTGYLWTENFPESALAVNEGRPQSMELSEDHLEGHWSYFEEFGREFFIIEGGSTLSKLCILGKDVPPCFEGASVSAPQISMNFSLTMDDDTLSKLAQMTEELKFALNAEGGLNSVEDTEKIVTEFEDIEEEVENEEEVETQEGEPADNSDNGGGTLGSGLLGGGLGTGKPPVIGDGGSGDDTGSGDNTGSGSDDNEPESGGSTGGGSTGSGDQEPDDNEPPVVIEDDSDDGANSEIRRRVADLSNQIERMNAELESLRSFKAAVEEAEKDAVIARYSMLSDEDKADVIEHKAEYTAQEIDEKLALAYVRKNVVFNEILAEEADENVATTFSLDFNSNSEYVPPMVSALRRTRQNNKL